jgi:endonuclease III
MTVLDGTRNRATITVGVDPLYSLTGSVGAMRRGPGDPTYRRAADGAVWLGCRAPSGAIGSLRLSRASAETVEATAYGPAAAWLLASAPDLLGLNDSEESRGQFAETVLRQGNAALVAALRKHSGFRVVRSNRVWDSLVPAVLEQKVTTREAHRSYARLVRKYGTAAPGAPGELRLNCTPQPVDWRLIPSWEWRGAQVDNKRASAIMRAAHVASRLEETVGMTRDEAAHRIRTVPGIGVWTAAEIMHRSHGDPDAVSVGDLHLPRIVCTALGGPLAAIGANDDRMLELLEPYRGHRYRVTALLYR